MSDFEKQRAEALVRAVALAGLNDTPEADQMREHLANHHYAAAESVIRPLLFRHEGRPPLHRPIRMDSFRSRWTGGDQ